MKVRWRAHEIFFVTLLVLANCWFIFSSFKGSWIVLLTQTGSLLLFYGVYLTVNLVIVPWVKKISFADFEKLLTLRTLKPVLAIVVTAYLLAIGVNTLSYYAQPHLVSYSGYQLLALLGYNDAPLTNLLSGFDRAVGWVIFMTVLGSLRELITWLIMKPVEKRAFRVMVLNNVTPLLLIYSLVPFLINPIHDTFRDYIAWTTPVMFLYVYVTFWFFPSRDNHQWHLRTAVVKLLPAVTAGALFFTVIFSGPSQKSGQFAGYWFFLLVIITPVCWLLYQQRKEKILQLRGMEAALSKSRADMQFLRSQINPHFLLNALNTLYGTAIKERSEQTAAGIQLLGDMMRFMLHDNQLDAIPIGKEITYLENYIALQKMRLPLSADILIEDNIDETSCNWDIAPMLLIPLVENAFKHGISFKEKSWVIIKLECTETRLSFEVRNSVHDRKGADTEKGQSGIGLQNVTERLKLLYAGKHIFTLNKKQDEFQVALIIHKNIA